MRVKLAHVMQQHIWPGSLTVRHGLPPSEGAISVTILARRDNLARGLARRGHPYTVVVGQVGHHTHIEDKQGPAHGHPCARPDILVKQVREQETLR
jgi:hypothetical protein